MTAMILAGAVLGGLLYLLAVQLFPAKPSPLTTLARLDAMWSAIGEETLAARTATGPEIEGRLAQLGGRLGRALARRGITYTTLRQDLALSGRSFEVTIAVKVLLGAGGFVGTLAMTVVVQTLFGFALPPGTPLIVALALGAGLFMLPDLQARDQARERRADFRHALGAFLDLVALEMAGSAAPAEALPQAARVGAGWPLALIRDTLFKASRAGTSPWEALSDLGSRVGVPELRDLGQLIALVAHDGAQVRSTLTARATTMRRRELADQSGEAESRDQSMRLAQIVVAMGYLLFLGYPAVAAVMSFRS